MRNLVIGVTVGVVSGLAVGYVSGLAVAFKIVSDSHYTDTVGIVDFNPAS